MSSVQRDFKGIWIPKEIWLLDELTITEKVMLVEINSLDNEEGCYAGNEYFAKFFGITTVQVSRIIKKLIDGRYIQQIHFDGRKRTLKSCININVKADFQPGKAGLTSMLKQDEHESLSSINFDDKHNNTFNNPTTNTVNNKKPSHVSINNFLYLASDWKINVKLIKEWDKTNWNGIEEESHEDVLRYIKYRTETIDKPIKSAKGMNAILNNIRGRSVIEIKKQVDKVIEKEWTDLRFYDNNKTTKDKWADTFKTI